MTKTIIILFGALIVMSYNPKKVKHKSHFNFERIGKLTKADAG